MKLLGILHASILCATGSLGYQPTPDVNLSRRSVFFLPPAVAALVLSPSQSNAAGPNGLTLNKASSGLQWADVREGSGQPLKPGAPASIDYNMASTVGRRPQIYTTKDKGSSYRWTLGDGTTIQGIEQAILGADDIPPMLPGGIRRVIIPAKLGYESILSKSNPKCLEGEHIGPIPPKNSDGAYQRWYQQYCNPRIPYQPDIVLDLKLYGKRTKN
eukprot:scaffold24757_cov122-Cylindrotheca_fusiformis.AAC.2